jgi:hypothetical protein
VSLCDCQPVPDLLQWATFHPWAKVASETTILPSRQRASLTHVCVIFTCSQVVNKASHPLQKLSILKITWDFCASNEILSHQKSVCLERIVLQLGWKLVHG